MNLIERFTARYPGVSVRSIEARRIHIKDALGAQPAEVFWLDDEPQGAVVLRKGRGVFVAAEDATGAAHDNLRP